METTLHEPEITAKKGRLKSRRKSRKENINTTDDLATLENLDEVNVFFEQWIEIISHKNKIESHWYKMLYDLFL